MAINLPNQHRRLRRRKMISEINVTPMVDVMLVLLIIFMIAAPMLVGGVEVELQKTDLSPLSGQYKPLIVSVNKGEDIYLLETKIAKGELVTKLQEVTKQNKELRIFVKGDKHVAYGKIVEVMAEIYNAGYKKVSLISDIK
ncbi:MAG: biopolymer transporter ExbD [Rickettsiaceae bacterium]|nr:biopolymer transporter ExbD [Rickettsiaceae bacterium]